VRLDRTQFSLCVLCGPSAPVCSAAIHRRARGNELPHYERISTKDSSPNLWNAVLSYGFLLRGDGGEPDARAVIGP